MRKLHLNITDIIRFAPEIHLILSPQLTPFISSFLCCNKVMRERGGESLLVRIIEILRQCYYVCFSEGSSPPQEEWRHVKMHLY